MKSCADVIIYGSGGWPMTKRLVLSVLYLFLVASFAGCSMNYPPLQIEALGPLNTSVQNSDMKKLKLCIINSENTRNAYRYIAEWKALYELPFASGRGSIDPDSAGLEKAIRDILGTIFIDVAYVNDIEQAQADHAQVVAIVDLNATLGKYSGKTTTLDITVDLRKLDGASIEIFKGSGKSVVPWPATTVNWRPAAKDALEHLTTALLASVTTPRFAAKIVSGPRTADSAVGSTPGVVVAVKSDVDEIPAGKAKSNKDAYAIVIGIENYRQKLPKADFATHDAQTMTEYLTKVLGYPEENVITLLNDKALKSDFAKYFEKWLSNNVEAGSTVFVYYSGHGAPDVKSGSAYLVPYDGDPAFIDQTGYSLNRMYDALGKLPAKKIIVALDSCFSGAGGRSVIAKGARPLVMSLQRNVVLSKNLTVMSASSGDQSSSTYDEKGHGLFTYFMLKGIKSEDVAKRDGSIDINDLFSYVKPQVERIARKQYNNEQTPQLIEQQQ